MTEETSPSSTLPTAAMLAGWQKSIAAIAPTTLARRELEAIVGKTMDLSRIRELSESMSAVNRSKLRDSLKAMQSTVSSTEANRKRMLAMVQAPAMIDVKPYAIEASPLITYAARQIEHADRQIEMQEEMNEGLQKVVATLETELAESRADARASRRSTKIALWIASGSLGVTVALGVAALVR